MPTPRHDTFTIGGTLGRLRSRVAPDRVNRANGWTGALRILLCLVLVLQSTTYGVISPLLPELATELGLRGAQVGLVTGAYTIGMLPASLALVLVRSAVPDAPVVIAGMGSLATGCLLLTADPTFTVVLTARFLMGLGAGFCFAAGVRWLVGTAPGREGLFFGLGWGMLSVGNALGPVLGALAASLGRAPVHAALGVTFVVCLAALAALARRAPSTESRLKSDGGGRLRVPVLGNALLPLTLPALLMGVLYTLVPLRLADLRQPGWIAVAFSAAAVLGALASPAAGQLLARVAAPSMLWWSLPCTGLLVVILAWPVPAAAVAIVTVLVLGGVGQAVVVAAGEQLRKALRRTGARDVSSALITLMFAVFETVGAVAGSQAVVASAPLPYAACLLIAVVCAVAVRRQARGTRGR
ncbi:MFS transporter [Streptomyces sp. NBC_00144]|uniref:MFS transporter n=1 Tax=Streptomyces sp. NBC_00144 TaxID=2975665 RepID=UPI00324B6C54